MTAVTVVLGLSLLPQRAAATARAPEGVIAQKVTTSDLDLTREADGRILLQRIRRASHAVCVGGQDGWQQYVIESGWYRDCVRQAQNRAVTNLGAPMVTALYSQGRPSLRLASNDRQP